MKLQQASITDYASVLSFYNDVTEHTPEIDLYTLEEGEVSDS